jgi:hypothetical protein
VINVDQALNEPGAAETVAWEAVSAAVDKLYEFYAFSLHLGIDKSSFGLSVHAHI